MSSLNNLKERTCPRCKGHQKIRGQAGSMCIGDFYMLPNYKRVRDGVCFLCDGTGKALFTSDLSKVVKFKDGKWLHYNSINGAYVGVLVAAPQTPSIPEMDIDEWLEENF